MSKIYSIFNRTQGDISLYFDNTNTSIPITNGKRGAFTIIFRSRYNTCQNGMALVLNLALLQNCLPMERYCSNYHPPFKLRVSKDLDSSDISTLCSVSLQKDTVG